MIELKKWDSDFFNLRIGHKTITKPHQEHIENDEFDVIYVFSKNSLDQWNKDLVDIKIVLECDINSSKTTLTDHNPYLFKQFDILTDSYEELEQLAIESGHLSRFKVDKKFGDENFTRLYKKWIENIYNSDDVIIVVKKENSIVGFVSIHHNLENQTATIGLVAVDKKARGLGIGKSLMIHSIKNCLKHSIVTLRVATQQDNTGALKLYESCGFTVIDKTYIYHLWREDAI